MSDSTNKTKDPKHMLKLQAEVKRRSLPDLCRSEGRNVTETLRVAWHVVEKEEVEGQPPRQHSPAIHEAMQIHKLENRIEDPGWPESARVRYQENKATVARILSELKKQKKQKRKKLLKPELPLPRHRPIRRALGRKAS